jgi:DNA invertase Pin-like site-specific DNA recombinase
MTIRTYRRRSKSDEGKQQFSLDVQTKGCDEHIERMGLAAEVRIDYVDDGRAGDDFLGRTGLRKLLADAKRGDVIICRDQSRLGRDAIEVTLVVRDLVRDRGCRLLYYASGQEVAFANAIDQATTFIQGTGHQMEMEAIRSRTREGLRSRVRQGRIAGGACYGYNLVRKSDGSGPRFTIAVVDETQAPIVERIYREYLAGRGLKQIAHQLNHEGVHAPSAGRRGSGSWAPSAVRTILLNARYRGVYIHGRIKKVRQGGGTIRVKADPTEMLTVEIPEWRIVDDATWFEVNAKFTTRAAHAWTQQRQVSAHRHREVRLVWRCDRRGTRRRVRRSERARAVLRLREASRARQRRVRRHRAPADGRGRSCARRSPPAPRPQRRRARHGARRDPERDRGAAA